MDFQHRLEHFIGVRFRDPGRRDDGYIALDGGIDDEVFAGKLTYVFDEQGDIYVIEIDGDIALCLLGLGTRRPPLA